MYEKIRCQIIAAQTEQELLEIQLTLLVEMCRRQECPEMDIVTYFETILKPRLECKETTNAV